MSVIKKEEVFQETENGRDELSVEDLSEAVGAGNPFENIPRVPTQPIDDELRNKS